MKVPLLGGRVVDVPEVAVLWHSHADDSWSVVWLGDDIGTACDESLRPRPAMEPGDAVVVSLSPLSLVPPADETTGTGGDRGN